MKRTLNIATITQKFDKGSAKCTIEECKTAYYVTIHPAGWSLPVVVNYRVKKTRIVTNPMAALYCAYIDYNKSFLGKEVNRW